MLRFMNAANALSLAGLGAAFAAALLAIHGRAAHALVAFMVAGLCDLFDGFVARRLSRTDEEKRFGGHLDSVVDACSLGLAPAIVLHAALGLRSAPEIALCGVYACCAVWRLAYFDTVGMSGEGDAKYFTGVPVTYGALVIPLACLAGFAGPGPLRVAAAIAASAHAAAMVSPLRIRKPFGKWYFVLIGIAVALIATYVAGASRFPGGAAPPM